jgi:hypothetical protein
LHVHDENGDVPLMPSDEQKKQAVLFPNYRGSIGFEQASIASLLTPVGSLDVQDIMAATNHVLETMSDTLDASRVIHFFRKSFLTYSRWRVRIINLLLIAQMV